MERNDKGIITSKWVALAHCCKRGSNLTSFTLMWLVVCFACIKHDVVAKVISISCCSFQWTYKTTDMTHISGLYLPSVSSWRKMWVLTWMVWICSGLYRLCTETKTKVLHVSFFSSNRCKCHVSSSKPNLQLFYVSLLSARWSNPSLFTFRAGDDASPTTQTVIERKAENCRSNMLTTTRGERVQTMKLRTELWTFHQIYLKGSWSTKLPKKIDILNWHC